MVTTAAVCIYTAVPIPRTAISRASITEAFITEAFITRVIIAKIIAPRETTIILRGMMLVRITVTIRVMRSRTLIS